MTVGLNKVKYRVSKAEIVKAAMFISGRSRSTVYAVIMGNMRSQPVDDAISMARVILDQYCRDLAQARQTFASSNSNHNGKRQRN